MTEPKPIALVHPGTKAEVETRNPEAYLSQGWEEKGKKPAPEPDK